MHESKNRKNYCKEERNKNKGWQKAERKTVGGRKVNKLMEKKTEEEREIEARWKGRLSEKECLKNGRMKKKETC
jgi:hypothetical protein